MRLSSSSFDVYQEVTTHISTHWNAGGDSYSSVHLNFYVPKDFLSRLVTVYSDRFTDSVRICLGLLKQPLFGRENGERLELSTHLGGMVPLKYWLIRENKMPPAQVVDGLVKEFERFARLLASSGTVLMEQRQGQYFSGTDVKYRRISKKADAKLELCLAVPATATKRRLQAFRLKALSICTFRQENGENYIACNEDSLSLGYGLFAVTGKAYGKVTTSEVVEELRHIFDDAAVDLTFPD